MIRIESPTSKEHLRRLAIFLALCVGFGGWFVYDVRVRYPRANAALLAGSFDPVPPPVEVERLKSRINWNIALASKERIAGAETLEAVEDVLGEPTYKDQHGKGAYQYLGPGGLLTVNHSGGMVTSVNWKDGVHTPADLTWQWVFAAICGVVALIVAVRLWSAWRIRVVLSEAGLSPAPGRVISWEQMTGLRTEQYRQKGWLELQYDSEGAAKQLRLDSYKIREFRPLISALCGRKGFSSPFAGAGPSSPGAAAPRDESSSD